MDSSKSLDNYKYMFVDDHKKILESYKLKSVAKKEKDDAVKNEKDKLGKFLNKKHQDDLKNYTHNRFLSPGADQEYESLDNVLGKKKTGTNERDVNTAKYLPKNVVNTDYLNKNTSLLNRNNCEKIPNSNDIDPNKCFVSIAERNNWGFSKNKYNTDINALKKDKKDLVDERDLSWTENKFIQKTGKSLESKDRGDFKYLDYDIHDDAIDQLKDTWLDPRNGEKI